jgi:hypothetical protein
VKFATLSTLQLFFMTLMMAIITALLVCINSWYMTYIKLPKVHVDGAGACVKVENFENGHAFNCADVDVLLRQYRKSTQ